MNREPRPDWESPKDLRCIGGPADGQWYAVPPFGYVMDEMRGGAYWRFAQVWPLPVLPHAAATQAARSLPVTPPPAWCAPAGLTPATFQQWIADHPGSHAAPCGTDPEAP